MDLAENSVIQQVLIKGKGAYEITTCPPPPQIPSKAGFVVDS